ncbi:hypothetical protein [Methylocapsa sp. S129]|uniref:hypothetical protein n=1 Tax=Methylocapsa sp. S129 TaxID=1641869 RepID=UPI00131D9CBE|nr:hypothetical protein [Methylocapsa sp. S129]
MAIRDRSRTSLNRRRNFVLAAMAALPHSAGMGEDHQFTVRVEPDSSRPGRFRWALFKATQAYNRSEMSFSTKREAAQEAAKVLDKRIAAWQALR